MKKQNEQKYVVYNHRIIWAAAKKNLNLATPENKDSKLHSLAAMFLFFTAFEGYLNWLGGRIAPEAWKDERHFFSRSPYKGTLGKYCFLSKILNLPDPDPSKGAFQTAKELKKFRDIVAHPKIEEGERTVTLKEGYFPRHYESELNKKVSAAAALKAKEHLNELADSLHGKAKEIYSSVVCDSSAFSSTLEFSLTEA